MPIADDVLMLFFFGVLVILLNYLVVWLFIISCLFLVRIGNIERMLRKGK